MSERPRPTVSDEQVRKRFDEIIRVGIPVWVGHISPINQDHTLVTGSQLVTEAAREIAEDKLEIPDQRNFLELRVGPGMHGPGARNAVIMIAGAVIKIFDRPLTPDQRNRQPRHKPPGK